MQTDSIAILLATYNGEKYLQEQLDSLRNQTCEDWVAFLHDDGSTDRTPEIIRAYAEKYPEHFRVVPGEPCGGASRNFLYLFGQVEAELYMCCDQDDVWLPDKIEKTLRRMEEIRTDEEKPCLVFTDLKVVDRNLKVISDTMDVYQKLHASDTRLCHVLAHGIVTGCTMMVNRKLRELMIRKNQYSHMIMHDWWAALVAAQFGTLCYLPEATILYRQHGDNSLGAENVNFANSVQRAKGSEAAKNRRQLEKTRNQAMEFAQTYGLGARSLAAIYGSVGEKNKLCRVGTYFIHHFHKGSFAKTIGLYVFG